MVTYPDYRGMASARYDLVGGMMNTKTLGTDESDLVKAEIEKRIRKLEVTVKHKVNYGVSFYDVTITDGFSYARQEFSEHNLGGPHQAPFFDRMCAGLVQLFAVERYLVKRGE